MCYTALSMYNDAGTDASTDLCHIEHLSPGASIDLRDKEVGDMSSYEGLKRSSEGTPPERKRGAADLRRLDRAHERVQPGLDATREASHQLFLNDCSIQLKGDHALLVELPGRGRVEVQPADALRIAAYHSRQGQNNLNLKDTCGLVCCAMTAQAMTDGKSGLTEEKALHFALSRGYCNEKGST